jgi:uncharacterized alkaline shock family protein YloU
MSEEIRVAGLGVAPGVLDTIVTLALEDIEGVAFASSGQGFGGIVNRASGKAVDFTVDDDGAVDVRMHITAVYGTPIRAVAARVQECVADAIQSQVGAAVGKVDVYVDGIEFPT